MKPSKLQHWVDTNSHFMSKFWSSAGYAGPSGSGESWLTPEGAMPGESYLAFVFRLGLRL
jgi:hypothetical protein